MSAYTSFLHTGARADLPASYAEIWAVLSGALRVGAESDAVTVRAGDFGLRPRTSGSVARYTSPYNTPG